jgi:cytochrome P450
MRLTLEIVAKTLFDSDVAKEAKAVGEALEVTVAEFPAMLNPVRRFVSEHVPTPSGRRLAASIKKLDEVVFEMIRARKESGSHSDDLLSMLLDSRDEDGSGMSAQQLRDEVMTLFLAGHETTAIAITWTFHLLAANPDVRRMLEVELENVLGPRKASFADLPNLPYTDAIVKESLRLYPPAWAIGRIAARDTELGGFPLKAGTSILVSPWVTHRDGRYFEKPLEFRPERWLPGSSAGSRHRFSYFPFGGGPRTCIGNSFATMEAVLLVATIARRFRLDVVPGQAIEPVPSITLRPKNGLRVIPERVPPR